MFVEQSTYQGILIEQIDNAQKLWELWRGIPVLERTAVALSDILTHPEKYQIEKYSYGTTESFAGEPIPSSIAFVYELPPYVNGSIQEATLKVKFILCNSVLAAERFEPHISLIFISGVGDETIETPYALTVVQSATGITLEAKGVRGESGSKRVESTITKILANTSLKPKTICCTTQGGIKGTISRKID